MQMAVPNQEKTKAIIQSTTRRRIR